MGLAMCPQTYMQQCLWKKKKKNWGQSAFLYETQKGLKQNLFHGTQAVAEQIVNIFLPLLLFSMMNKQKAKALF